MKIHLYNLPSVDQYVNQLISSYITIQTDFNQGDILLADKINHLKEKSRYMIKNIDQFMTKNALDQRVKYLYCTRNKLAKFLFKIEQNALVKNVNQINQNGNNKSVYQTPINKKEHQLLLSNEKQNKSSSIIVKEYQNESAIVQNHNEEQQYHLDDHQSQHKQFSQVKRFTLHQQQQKTPFSQYQFKQQLNNSNNNINNSSFITGHNRTPSVKLRPTHQEYEKQKERQKHHRKQQSQLYYDSRQKSRTPIKTSSRKTQLFIPKQNITSSKQQQLSNNDSARQGKASNTKRRSQYEYDRKQQNITISNQQQLQQYQQKQQQRLDNKKSSNYTQRSKLINENVIQKTPSKSTAGLNTYNNLRNSYESFGNNRQQQNSNNNIQKTFEKNTDKFQHQLTPNKQQLIAPSAPSSAMRSLANLIFTIKMTKQQYNEFKKIKQQHQGVKQSYMQ